MSIDVHAHFWTDAYLDKVAALGKTDTAGSAAGAQGTAPSWTLITHGIPPATRG